MRLALAGYLIPFMFVLNPAMLLQDTDWVGAISVTLTAIFGVLMLAVAIEGHLMVEVPWAVRLLFFVSGLTMMTPDTLTDLVGVALAAVAVIFVAGKAKKEDSLSIRSI